MREDLQHEDEVSSKACPMTIEMRQGDVLQKDEALSKASPTTLERKQGALPDEDEVLNKMRPATMEEIQRAWIHHRGWMGNQRLQYIRRSKCSGTPAAPLLRE